MFVNILFEGEERDCEYFDERDRVISGIVKWNRNKQGSC